MKDGVFGGVNIPTWIKKHAEPEDLRGFDRELSYLFCLSTKLLWTRHPLRGLQLDDVNSLCRMITVCQASFKSIFGYRLQNCVERVQGRGMPQLLAANPSRLRSITHALYQHQPPIRHDKKAKQLVDPEDNLLFDQYHGRRTT